MERGFKAKEEQKLVLASHNLIFIVCHNTEIHTYIYKSHRINSPKDILVTR